MHAICGWAYLNEIMQVMQHFLNHFTSQYIVLTQQLGELDNVNNKLGMGKFDNVNMHATKIYYCLISKYFKS